MKIEQYYFYWANLEPTTGSELDKIRPVVIVSPDIMNKFLETVVCPLTTSLHPEWKHRIQAECGKQLSEIAIDQIRTISKRRIKKKIGPLERDALPKVGNLICELYGFPS